MAYDNGGQGTYVNVKRGSKATCRPHKNEGKFYKPTRAEDVNGESPKGVETTSGTVSLGLLPSPPRESPKGVETLMRLVRDDHEVRVRISKGGRKSLVSVYPFAQELRVSDGG